MNSVTEIWSIIYDLLKQQMTATSVHTWFDDVDPVILNKGRFIICHPTQFKRDVIRDNYLKTLEDAFYELFSERIAVEIVSPEERETLLRELNQAEPTVNSRYTFDRFVVGESNRVAYNAACAVAEKPADTYNPLFLYGEPGLGKTHLLYAIYNAVKAAHPEYKIIAVTGEEFTNEVTEAIRCKSTDQLRAKYRGKDMLLVADIQFIAGKEATQIEFFNTFNTLYHEGHQIVLISDRPPSDMIRLEERLRSRFESGLICDIQAPEYETRLAIVEEKARQMGLQLDRVITETIARNITGNVRQLEGTIKMILAERDLGGQSMDNDTIIAKLSILLHDQDSFLPTPDSIISATAKCYGLETADILSTSRTKEIALARQVAMYIVRYMTKLSLPEIGKIFDRDHTTVIHSIEKVEGLMRESREVSENIRDIKSNVNSKSV